MSAADDGAGAGGRAGPGVGADRDPGGGAGTVGRVATAAPSPPSRIVALGDRWPIVADVGPSLVLFVAVAAAVRSHPWGLVFGVALLLPLVVRRRFPVAAFAIVAGVIGARLLGDVRVPGDTALIPALAAALVALYAVAVRRPARTLWLAGLVIEVGIAVWLFRMDTDLVAQRFVGLSALVVVAGVLGTNARQRRQLLASLEERAVRLEHERDQQGQLAAAAERARIAREMHDVVAHNLTVMVALADGAGWALRETPDQAQMAIERVSRTGREALREMRALLGVLREDPGPRGRAPQPGLAEIEQVVSQLRAAGVPVDYVVRGAPPGPVPPGLQLAAHRIVQEALTNTLKHAGPGARSEVALAFSGERLELTIADSGTPSPGPVVEGGGLRSMRERVALYAGGVEAGPVADGGWTVRAWFPLDAPEGAPA